jgi:hypothetical protein
MGDKDDTAVESAAGVKTASQPNILEEALAVTSGDRNDSYGHPLPNHLAIAGFWSLILGITVTPRQVALCMIGLKLARETHKAKRDNLVDIAGYARALELIPDDETQGVADGMDAFLGTLNAYRQQYKKTEPVAKECAAEINERLKAALKDLPKSPPYQKPCPCGTCASCPHYPHCAFG